MLLTKSFYNRGLLRSDLRRSTSLLFLYVFTWILILPLQIWRQNARLGEEFSLDRCENLLSFAVNATIWINLFFAVGFAMILFAYLMNARAVCGMHSMPASRGCQYRTHLLSALGSVFVGNVLIFLLTALAQSGKQVLWDFTFFWLVCSCVTFLLFFAIATVCCMLTGWLLAVPVLYGAVNAIVMVVYYLIRALRSIFYESYTYIDLDMSGTVIWLTPVARLVIRLQNTCLDSGNRLVMPDGAVKTLVVYAVAAILLLEGGRWLYLLRRSEMAGDALVFRPLRPAVRWCAGLLGGIGMGLLLALLLDATDETPLFLLCQVVMGALCFLAAQMLIAKSYRIFRRIWPELLALCLVIVVFCVGVKQDVFGFERRIPAATKVQSVQIRSGMGSEISMTKPEDIAEVLAAHHYLVDRVTTEEQGYGDGYISFVYTLTDGTRTGRRYDLYDEDWEHMRGLLDTELFRKSLIIYTQDDLTDTPTFDYGVVYKYDENYDRDETINLTAEQCEQLYAAVCADARTLDMRISEQMYSMNITLWQKAGDSYMDLYLREDCTNSLQLLRQWGIIGPDEAIFKE